MEEILRNWFARHRYALGVGALVLLTAPLGVRSRPLRIGDETREAAIAKQMAESGDFLRTRLAGRSLEEKPPFYYASVASSIRLGRGATPFSTRLPSILFSAMTLLAASGIARILFSERAALLSAVVLATTYLFAANAHNVVVDVALTAFVSLGLLAFVSSTKRAGFPRWEASFGFAAAGALLAKGLIGVALLFLLTVPFWALGAPRRRWRECLSPAALLVPAAALLLWTGVAYVGGGAAGLSEAIWNQQFGRLLGLRHREYSHHRAPFYFYLAYLPGVLFPWTVTLAYAVARGVRERAARSKMAALAPLVAGLGAAVLFLSVAGTKRTIYFLPLVPVVAVLTGAFLDAKLEEPRGATSRGLWLQFAAVSLVAVGVLLIPAVGDRRISPAEAAGVVAAAAICLSLVPFARKSASRLISVSLLVALGSLLLLDLYALPRWKQDRATKRFFARVERRMSPATRLYSFELNEDVLGWACLELSRAPLAESDPALLLERLKAPDALVILEKPALAGVPADVKDRLEAVLRGRVESRPIALYRLRGSSAGGPAARASLRDLVSQPLPGEVKALPNSVGEEEPADQ
ncbi:MAG TPA: glycosyltransferase family 39 protein [Thermoanaerobaculia bacterium]|nr:glycosyltransferase family 39 protein [Thermoanaerobaculia bacterium]